MNHDAQQPSYLIDIQSQTLIYFIVHQNKQYTLNAKKIVGSSYQLNITRWLRSSIISTHNMASTSINYPIIPD